MRHCVGHPMPIGFDESTSNRRFNVQDSLDVRAERQTTICATASTLDPRMYKKTSRVLRSFWKLHSELDRHHRNGMPYTLYDFNDDVLNRRRVQRSLEHHRCTDNIHCSETTPFRLLTRHISDERLGET